MTESAFNRPVPVQEQQAALKAEPRSLAREAYEIGKEQEAEAATQAEALENALHDDETPTAPQDVIDALIAENNEAGELSRELTEAEASAAIEAAMQQRIAEAIDNDLETRARVAAIPVSGFAAQITEERGLRYEGTFQSNPIVSDPSLPPGVVARVRLTAEQLEATKHMKPGDAFLKAIEADAGDALEPEPAKKPEDLDGF